MEENMRDLHQPPRDVTLSDFYEGHIRTLNEQLYNAYKRIEELQQELKKQREQNGKD